MVARDGDILVQLCITWLRYYDYELGEVVVTHQEMKSLAVALNLI